MCAYVYFCIEVSAHTHTHIRQISLKENWYSTIVPGKRLFKKDFIYLFMREREREMQRHRQREKQPPCGEPDLGLDPRTPGLWTEPKANAQQLSHPGAPSFSFLIFSQVLYRNYWLPGTVLSTLQVCRLILIVSLWHPYLNHKQTKAQRHKITHSGSHSYGVAELSFEHGQAIFSICRFCCFHHIPEQLWGP